VSKLFLEVEGHTEYQIYYAMKRLKRRTKPLLPGLLEMLQCETKYFKPWKKHEIKWLYEGLLTHGKNY